MKPQYYATPCSHSHPQAAEVSTVTSLAARNAREQWENIFNWNYIQPVLQVYKTVLQVYITCWLISRCASLYVT